MISESTKVNIIDNSGAVEGKCIKVLLPKSYYGRRVGKVGDIIVLTITKTLTGSKIKKGDVMKALIVRTKRIQDGNRSLIVRYKKEEFNSTQNQKTLIDSFGKSVESSNVKGVVYGKKSNIAGYRNCYEDNSVVLIKLGTGKNKFDITPIGSRIKGPISDSIRWAAASENKHSIS